MVPNCQADCVLGFLDMDIVLYSFLLVLRVFEEAILLLVSKVSEGLYGYSCSY